MRSLCRTFKALLVSEVRVAVHTDCWGSLIHKAKERSVRELTLSLSKPPDPTRPLVKGWRM